jgi:nucleoside-diphosphate-sugar epimerase
LRWQPAGRPKYAGSATPRPAYRGDMTTVAVVGGHGKVARHLHPLLVRAGHVPVGLVRSDAHRRELRATGVQARLLDVEQASPEDFRQAFAGCQAVVFAAGAGPDGRADRKRTVDLEGSLKSMEAARAAGIRRFVQVSAMVVDDPVPEKASPVWRAYIEAKRDADDALRASPLDWTILRPGWLTDEPPTRRVCIGRGVPDGQLSRADLAAVITAVLGNDGTVRRQWEVVQDGMLIDEAIAVSLLREQGQRARSGSRR